MSKNIFVLQQMLVAAAVVVFSCCD